jgi:hypothetical protein
VDGVTVNGVDRSVVFNSASHTWTYYGPLMTGDNTFEVRAQAGASEEGPVTISVWQSGDPPPEEVDPFAPDVHFVGTWMDAAFQGTTAPECGSPWWPVGGFTTWDGSIEFARTQLLDMMSANIDLVGVRHDTKDATGATGYRFTSMVNVLTAALQLIEEGYRPPRIFMFLDTVAVNQAYFASQGVDLDVSVAAGQAELYSYVEAFYSEARSTFGARYWQPGIARYTGWPMAAFWHTGTGSIVGADNLFVEDLRTRFAASFGIGPYVIGHPDGWGAWAATDEVTTMFGPSSYYLRDGNDYAEKPTINLTPGYWNPLGDAAYLARAEGSHYNAAWSDAKGSRTFVDHIWIDSWNRVEEGSGIFDGQSLSHAASYAGSCGTWVNRHADAWGPDERRYIKYTAGNASEWSDDPTDDAEFLAHDIPENLAPGERRMVTVWVRNTGTRPWTGAGGDALDVVTGDLWVPNGAGAIDDTLDEIAKYGGIFRGRPRAFTFEITGRCEPGEVTFSFRMIHGEERFGDTLWRTVTVP